MCSAIEVLLAEAESQAYYKDNVIHVHEINIYKRIWQIVKPLLVCALFIEFMNQP